MALCLELCEVYNVYDLSKLMHAFLHILLCLVSDRVILSGPRVILSAESRVAHRITREARSTGISSDRVIMGSLLTLETTCAEFSTRTFPIGTASRTCQESWCRWQHGTLGRGRTHISYRHVAHRLISALHQPPLHHRTPQTTASAAWCRPRCRRRRPLAV
jgi:hypothetical protein